MNEAKHTVKVAVDAMGGDYAPEEIVKGAVLAAEKNDDVEVILVGPSDAVATELAKYKTSHLPLHCVEAEGFISESESPTIALRRRPNASIAVAFKIVKAGEADAVVGAGSTGALVTSAIRSMGMLKGIERPVVGGPFFGVAPNTIIMDCGVNVDSKPSHLLTFAVIGSIYAKKLLNIANPTVALLNVGAEENKGNRLTRETYPLLQKSGLNFIGNIEGSEVLSGRANVIVCDGFVGNILIKFGEGGIELIRGVLRNKVNSYPLLRFFKKPFKVMSSSMFGENGVGTSIGDGLIWGLDGIAIKIHGASRAPDVARKIAQARLLADMDVIGSLKSELAAIRSQLKL
ncbi:Phosphate acyltransferase [subsurface metagenome]